MNQFCITPLQTDHITTGLYMNNDLDIESNDTRPALVVWEYFWS